MVLDYSSFTCVGLCRDVVCIVFGNQTEQSGVGAGRRKRNRVDAVFASLDHEPEKLAQGAARALAAISGCTAAVTPL